MKHYLLLFFVAGAIQSSIAQEQKETTKKEPPAFILLRSLENYSYLKDKENSPYEIDFYDTIKYLPVGQSGEVYFSFGGQIRTRYESYTNRFWLAEGDEHFYSQRLAIHTKLGLGKYVYLFGELYHGYTSHQKEFAEYDELDVFQAFAAFKIPLQTGHNLSLQLGRQEMGLGLLV